STPVVIDEELDVLRGVSIFPIPSEGLLNITFMERAKVDLAVLDITGKVLLQERMNGVATQLDLSDKRSGVYVLQLTSEQGTHFERFILNH
ncbi:MAG: T9SS type A sorting domain-containing protein, partial [Flavobacteriales bacterium]|nr:T9SS type A sorting domain-containing protein [Flavobacteriales bacterium]